VCVCVCVCVPQKNSEVRGEERGSVK